MQLDSHRRQLSISTPIAIPTSVTMPCRWSNRCQAAAITEDASADGDKEVEHWRHVRRYNLRMMRKQVRTIILFMALMEAIRIGPVQMVFAGKEGYPAAGEDDFGVSISQ